MRCPPNNEGRAGRRRESLTEETAHGCDGRFLNFIFPDECTYRNRLAQILVSLWSSRGMRATQSNSLHVPGPDLEPAQSEEKIQGPG